MELTGARVHLRVADDGDVDDLVGLLSEPEVQRWWGRFDHDRVRNKLLQDGDACAVTYAVLADAGGPPCVVGLIQSYEQADPEYRSASIDIAIATAWHGSGVALDALRTLAGHLIADRGHHRLTIDPAADNARAIACYRKVGFRPVGRLRQYERGPDGTFHDGLLMDLLASELS